jgi:hypothetical protein
VVEKIFGLLFVLAGIFLAKTVLYPENQQTKTVKKIVKKQVPARLPTAVAPAPIPDWVTNDKLIASIIAETEKIEEIQFAKQQIHTIDVRSEESEEIKLRVQKAYRYFFPANREASYSLEIEVFRSLETHELILQGSIMEASTNNKVSEFGITLPNEN